ncbi:FimV/HubP family polar landmark protein [Rheinheimera sp. MMS21-TC3]|uniref:FimV/HubP family polar landmark protein n=1 Tax=Rheinheimera sp. MMS21-TC3 TaxID=3072790 RepID=UPI0028C50C8D|nr:FimV/HubP family polar landmark protein [Rheinheimera sp. MMS21-TC3]WNO61473.1 FimV/HubP family polar landmark protein [Rheinheimera sp. MMS21-TC3]
MPMLFVVFFAVLVNFSSPLLAQEDNVQIRGPRSTDSLAQQATIGPLGANDTLWRVAERLKPNANVSLYQVMYALYQKNPDAFLDNNLNHLKPRAILKVPSLREVTQVDINLAKQKAEQDDIAWARRQQTAKIAVQQSTQQQQVVTTEPVSVAWQQELQQTAQQQREQLAAMRSDFEYSIQQVQTLELENERLKTSLTAIEVELEKLRDQLSQDNELQQQLASLIAQQADLLRVNAELAAKVNQDFNWQDVLKNPLSWVLAASIPALLVLFSILLIIKRRGKETEAVVNSVNLANTPDPSYQSPLPPLDDNDDIDESLFELDEALLEEPITQEDIAADEFSDMQPTASIDDELLDFDDELLHDDSPLPEPIDNEPTDIEDEPFDPDQILSDTDISALLLAEDEDEDEDEDETIIEPADDKESVTDELDTIEDLDFVDELTDDLASTETSAEDELSLIEQSLMDDAAEQPITEVSDADLIEQAFAEDGLSQSNDQASVNEEFALTDENTLAVDNKGEIDKEVDTDLADFENDVEVVAIDLADDTDSVTEQEQELTSALNQFELAEDSLVKAISAETNKLDPELEPALTMDLETDANFTENDADDIFEFDSTSLDEFAESLAQEQAPDLSTSDDNSVTSVTDATLSVENPSEMLEQYPDLDLAEDDFSLDIDSLSPAVLSAEAVQQENDEAIELDPLAEHQFDSLMGELEAIAGNVELTNSDSPEFALEHDDIAKLKPVANNDFDFTDDDFVEIDKLLASTAEQQETNPERFNNLNVDVGLDEFADVIGKQQEYDVDKDDNGYAAKLDLARAYIEMEDPENAEQILTAILESDAPAHVKSEAKALKS